MMAPVDGSGSCPAWRQIVLKRARVVSFMPPRSLTIVCYHAICNLQNPVRRWLNRQRTHRAADGRDRLMPASGATPPGAPPSPRDFEYLDTLPGRLLILSGALMLVLLVLRAFVMLPEILEIFRKVVTLAFIVAVIWLGALVFKYNRRLLLWRVRRKLILSDLLLGWVRVWGGGFVG